MQIILFKQKYLKTIIITKKLHAAITNQNISYN